MSPLAPEDGGAAGLLADLGRWSLAGAMVVGLHAGALAWYLRDRPEPASSGEPAAAIMIELAPLAEAIETDSTELSPDLEESAAAESAQAQPEPEPEPETPPLPEEPQETPPEEPLEEPLEEPRIEEPTPEAEVALPVTRSPRPPERPERPAPTRRDPPREPPRRQQQAPAAAAENRTRASSEQAQQSQRNAAAQSATGSGRTMSPARWQSRVMAHLERHKPRNASGRGQVLVGFTIDGAGNVVSARVARSSGQPDLDAMAVSVVQRASPVPAPPPGVSLSMTVAIEFSRR